MITFIIRPKTLDDFFMYVKFESQIVYLTIRDIISLINLNPLIFDIKKKKILGKLVNLSWWVNKNNKQQQ